MELTLTSLAANWPDPLPAGTLGHPYSVTLSASGGVAPYSYAAAPLPAGLSMVAGFISGTPSALGTTAVTASVTDSQTGTIMNPTKATWIEPTNPDGSPIGSGEITGYSLGIRPSTGTAGTYPTLVPVTGATTLTVPLPVLAAGSYVASIQAVGPTNGPWSLEVAFSIVEIPGAPTGFTIS